MKNLADKELEILKKWKSAINRGLNISNAQGYVMEKPSVAGETVVKSETYGVVGVVEAVGVGHDLQEDVHLVEDGG